MKEIILLLHNLEENHNHEENLLYKTMKIEGKRLQTKSFCSQFFYWDLQRNPPPPNSIQLQNELCLREMREQLVEFIAIYKPSVLDSSVGHCQMFRQGQNNWIFLQSTQIQPETFP